MLRRLGVRGKILATLAVPVLVLVIGAVFLSVSSISSTRLASATSEVVDSLRMQDNLTQALQAERTAAFNYTLERTDSEQQYEDAKKITDAAVRNFNTEVDKISLGPLDDAIVTAIDEARDARSQERLDEVRELFVDSDTVLNKTVEAQYGFIIETQMDVAQITADRMPDRDLGRVMNGYNAVDRTVNQTSLDSKLIEILLQDDFDGLATERALRSLSVEVTNGDTIRQQAEDIVDELKIPGVRMPVEFATYSLVRGALSTASPDSSSVTARMTWPQLAETELNVITPVRDQIRAQAIDTAQANSSAQTRQTILTLAVALLVLAASIAVALLVARRITGPLIRLTAAATHVREELPRLVDQVAVPGKGPDMEFDRIPIEDEDEVGRLAEAFNEVNATTLDIARQQAVLRGSIAEMFVNVARRDQVLLSRQLSFLDELERSEEDPNTLANLFRLDHLATRMRRNAESLLVLAGIESGRRVRDPMPMSDVIRTAASEIEQYDRIQLEIQTDPRILAHNALLAAHLLAELLENATIFSDPGTPVSVSESEDDRWVTIVIRDHGLGMTQDEIDTANEKASTYATGEIAGESRLGLYVVGRLAYRLGAVVRFTNISENGKSGIEARVKMPRALFQTDADQSLPEPLDPLNRRTQDATQAWVAPEPAENVGALQSRHAEPEAPIGIPVDLPALTDGATATGMPRRRSRAADTSAPAPSEALSSDEDERDIVLPPLQSSELPTSFTEAGDSDWSPISVPQPQGSLLPSRAPAAPVAADHGVPEHVEPAPVPKRASMFSNLRTRKDLDEVPENDASAQPDEAAEPSAPTGPSEPVESADAAGATESIDKFEQEFAPQIPSIDLSKLQTRTARREALSAASAVSAVSAYTGEYPIVQDPQQRSSARSGSAVPAQFVIPGLVEDTPDPVQAEAFEPTYAEPAPVEPVQLEPEAYETPADQPQEPQQKQQFEAQAAVDPFNGSVPPDAMAPLPDFSELVGRSARREAAEADRKGFLGFGRRKKKKSQRRDEQAAAPMVVPGLSDLTGPPPLTGFTPQGAPAAQAPVAQDFQAPVEQFQPAADAAPSFEPVSAPVAPEPEPAPESSPEQQFVPEQAYASEQSDPPEPSYAPEPQAWSAPQVSEPQASVPSAVSTPAAASAVEAQEPVETPRRGRDGHALGGFFSGTRKSSSESKRADSDAGTGLPARTRGADRPSFEPEQQAVLPETNFSFTPETQEDAWAPTMSAPETSSEGFTPRTVDPSAQFALQTGIQEQALSELSQLSSYRPNEMGGGGGSNLTKRVRSEVPDSTDDLSSQKISRDAAELRARLSSFVSATSRARDDAEQHKNDPDHAPQSH